MKEFLESLQKGDIRVELAFYGEKDEITRVDSKIYIEKLEVPKLNQWKKDWLIKQGESLQETLF